jgi:DDE superfamily endonuclease
MRAGRERPCLIDGCTCLSPGLARIARNSGRTAGFPTRPAAETKHELGAQLVEGIIASGWLTARWVVCDEGYGDSPAELSRLDAAGLWYLAEVPRDTKVWPLLETDGRTERALPSSWVPPQTLSRKGPAPRRERLHPSSPAKVTVEDLAKQWPASRWQRFRRL